MEPTELVVPVNPALLQDPSFLQSAINDLKAPYEVREPIPTSVVLLVSAPLNPDLPLRYELRGCVLEADLRCMGGEPDELLAKGTLDPGETMIPVTLSPQLAMASVKNDPFFGLFGAAVWVRGVVENDEESQLFLKSFVVMPDYEGGREANTPPTLSDLLVGDEEEEVPVEIGPDGFLEVEYEEILRFLPVIPEEDRQSFLVFSFGGDLATDQQGEIRMETEDMTVRFFSTCGKFDREYKTEQTVIFYEKEKDEDKNLSAEWTAPRFDPEATSEGPLECTLWFVVEDGRGGTNWRVLWVRVR
jgi:hypothetical protein